MSTVSDEARTVRSYAPQDPSDLVGEFSVSEPAEVDGAVKSARESQREWWALGAAGRSAALGAAAAALRARREEAIALVVREVGKPLGEATGEITRAISILEYYAQACFAAVGELHPPSLGGLLFSERRPHGVAGLITPWNFPLAIPLWKAAPALAAGNAVVLKPSPDSPACAELLEELLEPSVPPGTFTVVNGDAEAGRALVDAVDVVSFTGSDGVGRAVAAQAASRGIPAQCEMGGQNAAIVFDDADPARAAALISGAAMGYAGQKCTATRRVIAVGNDAFVGALADAVSALAVGAPDTPGTIVGPVINQDARSAVESAVAVAKASGGRLLTEASTPDEGWYVAPALIDGLAPDHELAQRETFGPIATIHRASDLDEAVRIANDVRFGLVVSIHGRDLDCLLKAADGIHTGLVKINAPTTGVDFYAPFGGEKDSSYGPREQGMAALSFYSTTRTVTVAPHG